MSYGKMNTFIDIITTQPSKDAEGFVSSGDTVLASVRAYKEDRHGNTSWASRAAFSSATALFKFRRVPSIAITPSMAIICKDDRYRIDSVEDIKGRGMYIEVLAEKIEPTSR